MDRAAIVDQVRQVLAGYLEGRGLDLVDIVCRYEGGELFLRIFVDWPEGGIALQDCARLNKEIAEMLDEKNILEQRYTLEVSSPGLDRPLKIEKDFRRCKGKKIKFFLNEPVNGKLEWDGVIDSVSDGLVYIKANDTAIEIHLSKINKAKQLL